MQVFQFLVPAYKWQQKIREIQTYDVVLMFDKNEVKGKHKLGKVDKVLPSRTDGIVRRAVVKYKNVKLNRDIEGSDLKRLKFKNIYLNTRFLQFPCSWSHSHRNSPPYSSKRYLFIKIKVNRQNMNKIGLGNLQLYSIEYLKFSHKI